MKHSTKPASTQNTLTFNLGTFEGFNFRAQCAIEHILTADEVVAWDHDQDGEAEFWPSGDRPEMALLFKGRNSVTASEVLALDRLLDELGGDTAENYLRIHHAMDLCTGDLTELTADGVEEHIVHVFFGSNFTDTRKDAAYELFELYYPEEYQVWEKSLCDGLIFGVDRFLDSPSFSVEEVRIAHQVALLIAPQ